MKQKKKKYVKTPSDGIDGIEEMTLSTNLTSLRA